jgi:hypothetical protein
MADVYVENRRAFLLRTQNVDGGWGYFPGKSSWLEPTAYAVLALHGQRQYAESLERAWRLIASWQLPDGSWRPGSQVQEGTWVTALGLILSSVMPAPETARSKAVDALLRTDGAERCTKFRIMELLGFGHIEEDTTHAAWPWRAGTSSWIEPTVHSVIALKKAHALRANPRVADRIREGEQMILARRCADGGWNHGAPVALNIPVGSYPESTALGLLALQGRAKETLAARDLARRYYATTKSPLARAWLAIALRIWGDNPAFPVDNAAPPADIMLASLQLLAHPDGNHELFRTREVA